MAQINADQNEVKALRAIGYNAHQTGEHVAAITSRGTYWDSEDSGYQEDGPTEDGIRQPAPEGRPRIGDPCPQCGGVGSPHIYACDPG